MRGDLVLGFDDGEFGLGLPIERQGEIAGKDLLARAVLELDDAVLGMGADLHPARPWRPVSLLLPRRCLGIRVVRVLLLVGFVMPDGASRRRAELAMTRHVAGDAADDGTLDAALRFRRRNRRQRQ